MRDFQNIQTSLQESVIHYAKKTAEAGDQKRVVTPGQAYQIGSDYIVIGRPITQAADPVAAYHAIKEEWTRDWV